MKYLAAFAVVIMLVLTSGAFASQGETIRPEHYETPATCTFQTFRPFASKIWNSSKWERDTLSKAVVDALHRRLACAPTAHRLAMKALWRKDKTIFIRHRHEELFRTRVTPYYCDGSWWATECVIPLNESGYGSGGGNLYGMLDAWALHGCTAFAPSAWDASKHYQDICAHRHWVEYGRGGWPSY